MTINQDDNELELKCKHPDAGEYERVVFTYCVDNNDMTISVWNDDASMWNIVWLDRQQLKELSRFLQIKLELMENPIVKFFD